MSQVNGRKPIRMSTVELVALLEEISSGIESGDTLEGSLEFHWTEDVDVFEVEGVYRIGMTAGQGGVIIVGAEFATT